MKLLEGFPFDNIARPDHGPVMRILVSMHPLTIWIPAIIVGFILGLLR